MERSDILDLARRSAEPAVTVLLPVEQPVAAHADNALRLRALLDRAIEAVESGWGPGVAEQVRGQTAREEVGLDADERAQGLAVLATPEDCDVLHLPFPVEEQVVVDRTFATRQLLEGMARRPRYRVLVLGGHRARLFEGRGDRLSEVVRHGFPLEVEPPHEWDAPHRDLPIHEEAQKEEQRIVYRTVDEALGAVSARDPVPVLVTAVERELARFDEVTRHADLIAGHVHGNFIRSGPDELAAVARPGIEAYVQGRRQAALDRLDEAYGRRLAVTELAEVARAASEGRGHELVLEERFETDGAVDDVIETVLLAGGDVEFVDAGALDDRGHVALILRYA